jgi:hypothetical protein
VAQLEDGFLRRAARLVESCHQARVPKIFDLYADPKEEYPGTATPNAWVGGPMMKIVVEFEASLKKYPPIAPGTPDPYMPPKSGQQ